MLYVILSWFEGTVLIEKEALGSGVSFQQSKSEVSVDRFFFKNVLKQDCFSYINVLMMLDILYGSDLINPLSANPTKWSNTLSRRIALSVFDHFVGLALKGLTLNKDEDSNF